MKDIHLFAFTQEFWKLKELIREGANVDDTSDEDNPVRYSPLIFASISGSVDILILLIVNGADINYKDLSGRTALHYASLLGYVECVKLLAAAHGIDIKVADKDECTPIQAAASLGCTDCIEVLIDRGSDPNSCDASYVTALHKAANLGFWDTVEYLIKKGARVNVQDVNGASPLHYAAYNRHYKAMRVLLENGANPNIIDSFGRTPLVYAAATGDGKSVSILLEYHAKPNSRSNSKRTALMVAAGRGHLLVCRVLLKHKADANIQDDDGFTALHYACKFNRKSVVAFLLQKKAKRELADKQGMTPLHLSILYQNTACALLLVVGKANVNTKNAIGMTALHTLLLRYRADDEYNEKEVDEEDIEELFVTMLDLGADLDAPGPDYERVVTPRVIAMQKGLNLDDLSESTNKTILRQAVHDLLSARADSSAIRFLQSKTHSLFSSKGEGHLFEKTAKLSGSIGSSFPFKGIDLNSARSLSDAIIRDCTDSGTLENLVNVFRHLFLIPVGPVSAKFWKLIEMFTNRLVINQKPTSHSRITFSDFRSNYHVKLEERPKEDPYHTYLFKATEEAMDVMFPPGIIYGHDVDIIFTPSDPEVQRLKSPSMMLLTDSQITPEAPPPPPVNKKIGRVKCRRFWWDKILNTEVPNTVFASSNWKDISVNSPALLENFVYYKNPNKTPKEERKKILVRILDQNKAATIEIVLSKISLTHDEIFRAVVEMDFDKLHIETFKALLHVCPNERDLQRLKEFKGDPADLCLADAFYVKMARIPNLAKRLQASIAFRNFESRVKDLKEHNRTVLTTLRKIEQSGSLKHALHVILAVGNYLNDGYTGAQAEGIKLHSVLRLSEFRANNNPKYNLLYHVLELITDTSFLVELRGLRQCSPNEVASLHKTMNALKEDVDVVRYIVAHFEPVDRSDSFKTRIQPFIAKAESLLRELTQQFTEIEETHSRLYQYFGETTEEPVTVLLNFFSLIQDEKGRQKQEKEEQLEIQKARVREERVQARLKEAKGAKQQTKEVEEEPPAKEEPKEHVKTVHFGGEERLPRSSSSKIMRKAVTRAQLLLGTNQFTQSTRQ